MRAGKTLVELATEIERQQSSKKDYVLSTEALSAQVTPHGEARLEVAGHGDYAVRPIAHSQIATRLKVPQQYYDRLLQEQPNEWARHVTERLHFQPERRMVRTLDGAARSFLSERYRRLDNYDLSQAVLPILLNEQGLSIMSAEITERRLYLQVVSARVTAEVKRGDVVQAGIVISNSEVGLGAVNVQPLVWRLACLNGMISADFSQRKYHVGRAVEEEGELESFYRNETLRADDRAYWMKVVDVVRGTLSESKFAMIVERMQAAAGERITGDPLKSVEVLGDKLGLNDGEQTDILRLLINGGDLTRYGLLNAVTALANDEKRCESYDRAVELEAVGGKVLTLSKSEWQQVAEAA